MSKLLQTYEDLHDVVIADVKGIKLENFELEQLQHNLDIWYDILVELKKEVELQLIDKKRELFSKSLNITDTTSLDVERDVYNNWRVKVIRFLNSIESRLRYVKRERAIKSTNDQ